MSAKEEPAGRRTVVIPVKKGVIPAKHIEADRKGEPVKAITAIPAGKTLKRAAGNAKAAFAAGDSSDEKAVPAAGEKTPDRKTGSDAPAVKKIAAAPAGAPAAGIRTAAYCRVSSMLENQRSSIESQKEHYENLIKEHPDWLFVGIYADEGISGTKMETRPALKRLLDDCGSGKVDLILTKSISRFARNAAECLMMTRSLTSAGVKIYFEKENIFTGTMESELMLSLLAGFAEYESRSLSGNMKWSLRKKFRSGTYTPSRMAYGYEMKDGTLSVVEEKAGVIRRIFRMTLSGSGMLVIANALNDEGIPAPMGGRWNERSLRQIVHNPIYKGDLLCQKTYKDENYKERINYGELDRYYSTDHHEAIISPEDFDKAQAVMEQRAKEAGYREGADRRHSVHRYAFSGVLRCAHCGGTMHRYAYSGKQILWICQNHAKTCPMLPQHEEDLKNAFINCLNKLAWSQNRRRSDEHILDIYQEMLENERKTGNTSLSALKKFVAEWDITDDPARFPDNTFQEFVESCTVESRKNIAFHFHCGLELTETLRSRDG